MTVIFRDGSSETCKYLDVCAGSSTGDGALDSEMANEGVLAAEDGGDSSRRRLAMA